MLTSEQRNGISYLLTHHELMMVNMPPPDDYRSLKEHIMMMELKEAISHLKLMLIAPKDFSTNFELHCRDRANRNQNTLLDFSVSPNSIVNQMYWDIALIVTRAKKLKDLIQILLPQVTSVMNLEIQDSLPPNLSKVEVKKAMEAIVPKPVIKPLSESDAEIPARGLEDFIISNQIIFDIRELAHYRYHWQESLYHTLHQEYPEIARKLYSHNYALRTLQHDIELLSHSGKKPRAAIEHLIHGLLLGGKKLTGEFYAEKSAQIAYEVFFSYWKTLPRGLCEQLNEMMTENQEITFEKILYNLLHGECVETVSTNLKKILNRAQNANLLNKAPSLTESQIHEIKHNCDQAAKRGGLDTKKVIIEYATLPKSLLIPALQSIKVRTIEKWFDLLLNFPPEIYDDVFKYISLNRLNNPFDELSMAIKASYFNLEHHIGFGKALAQNPQLLGGIDNALIYVINTENIEIVTHFCANELLLKNVSLKTKKMALKTLIGKPELMKYFLTQLPEAQRIEVIKQDSDVSLLHGLYNKPALIIAILTSLPEAKRIDFIKEKDKQGNTLLHKLFYTPKLLTEILEVLPKDQRIDAINEKNLSGNTLLHIVYNDLETIIAILTLLPEGLRIKALQEIDKDGDTLLHKEYVKPQSLTKIITLLPEAQRIDAVRFKNRAGEQVIQKAAILLDSLVAILTILPERDRVGALLVKGTFGLTPMDAYCNSFESLKRISSLLPKDQRFDALNSINSPKKEKNFLFQIEVIRQKSLELREKGKTELNYLAAAEAAEQLIESLDQYSDELLIDNDYEKFKRNCSKAINKSRPVLENHRGWKQILGNLILAIIGLGVIYGCAVLYNKYKTGNCLFFKTDSATKLDELCESLGSASSCKYAP